MARALDFLFGRNDLEYRAQPLTSAELVDVLAPGSRTDSGVNVSETNAASLTAVYRSVALLAGVIATLPVKRYQDAEGGRIEVPTPLLRRPHPTFTRFELVELIMVHLLLNGNAYLVKQRNRLGEVVGLLPVNPRTVTPHLDDNGIKTFEVPGTDQPRITVGTDVILHIPGLGYDGVKGWSPIGMCRQSLGVALAENEFVGRFFGNGSHLGGVLQTDATLTPDQADDAKRIFKDKVTGMAKAHEVAVLHAGLKYEQLGVNPDDAELLGSRHFSIEEVSRIFGIPPHLLSESEGSTSWGSGLETNVRGLLTFTLNPWLTRIEDRLTREVADDNTYFEFTREGLIQADTKSKNEAYEIAARTGWLTIDEIRERENLPPMPNAPVAEEAPSA